MDDIKTFGDQAQAIIITGDMTDSGTPADYKEYEAIMSEYKLPSDELRGNFIVRGTEQE